MPRFDGAAFGAGASFTEARFRGDVSVSAATFGERASFFRAVFEGDVLFRNTSFGWGATFSGARFGGDARFEDARFGQGDPAFQTGVAFDGTEFMLAVFSRTAFRNGATFDRARFGVWATFHDATFDGEAGFSWIKGKVFFTRATFLGEASLYEAELVACSFDHVRFAADANFTRLRAGSCSVADATFDGDANFQESTIESAWIRDTTFAGDASFWGSTFEEEARFGRGDDDQWRATTFAKAAFFDHARFLGEAQFAGVTVGGSASFDGTVFERERHLGPISAAETLSFADASFRESADLDLVADRLSLSRARFPAGVNIWARWAEIVMEKAQFGASSILSGADEFTGLDEARLSETLAPIPFRSARPRVVSMRWASLEHLTMAGVDLSACRFAGAHNLDRLRLEGGSSFAHTPRGYRVTARQSIAEEHEWRAVHTTAAAASGWYPKECEVPDDIPRSLLAAGDIATVYRDLRKGREDNKDEPGAADFYYGEMEMRRLSGRRTADRERPAGRVTDRGERVVLTLYWLVSGYGLRASRALVSLALTVVVFAALFYLWGFESNESPLESLTFALESTTNLFRAPERQLTIAGEWLQVGLRLLGPLFFGLALFSLRGRVKR